MKLEIRVHEADDGGYWAEVPSIPGCATQGDVVVDTKASHEVYRKWLEMTRPAPGPGGLRRPLWFSRPVRPDDEAYLVKD